MDERFPTSFPQQRLWTLEQMRSGTPLYNVPLSLWTRGPLNRPALEKTFAELLRRHEILRTRFEEIDGQPVQVISENVDLSVSFNDLAGLPAPDRTRHIEVLADEEARTPFSLSRAPLLRLKVVRLGNHEHLLLITLHHIISDGWSLGVMVREVSMLYSAFAKGLISPLPELPLQYADYAHWQRQQMQAGELAKQLEYWQEQLQSIPDLVTFPSDRARPAIAGLEGGRSRLSFSPEVTEQLKALSRRKGVTLFMTLLATFEVLMAVYSGEEDIIVGTPVANRTREEIELLIGFFVNTLVLRTDLSSNPTFEQLLERVRVTCVGAYSHQDLPFERLVEELRPARDLGRHPLFQVMFAFHNVPQQKLELEDLSVEVVEGNTGTSKFDFNVLISETTHGLTAGVEYRTDLYEPETIDRILRHWTNVISSALREPARPISELELLDKDELQQVLQSWNRTERQYHGPAGIQHLFEQQVQRTPAAIAAVFEGATVTYKELEQQSNCLAHHLRRIGVRQESLVALLLNRSLSLLVGILGILKAGGAYVPLDPMYPDERLRFMVKDTGAEVIVTEHCLGERFPQSGLTRVFVEDAFNDADGDHQLDSIHPDSLAYVMYTSGSTGLPKGVMLSHRLLVNLVWWHNSELRKPERTLQFASSSFDASFFEIFFTLTSGGAVHLVSEQRRNDLSALATLILEERLDRLNVPSQVLQFFVDQWTSDGAHDPSSSPLRDVFANAERLKIGPSVAHYFGKTQATLHDQYGPTETHVVTSYTLPTDSGSWPSLPPIGRPICNTRVYVLDRGMRPAPVGVKGELYIGGLPLARGYLNRPNSTAEKFLADPFSPNPGSRMYKTGDVVRLLPSGDLDYVGRSDDQVKIRGFRIEPGEIEAGLSAHVGVQSSVVVTTGDQGNLLLVAYFIPSVEPGPSPNELRAFLQQTLPDFMIPVAFVAVGQFSLTPNGKVNRKALPQPQRQDFGIELNEAQPNSPAEMLVTSMMAQILERESVGSRDNFFHIGGHSLSALRLLSRVTEVFGLQYPLELLFASPNAASITENLYSLAGGPTYVEGLAETVLEVQQLSPTQVQDELSGFQLSKAQER